MPRKYELSWDKTHRRWIKTIAGVKHYFEKADRKADIDAYKRSVAQYHQLIGQTLTSPIGHAPTPDPEPKSPKRRRTTSGSYKHPATSMAGVVERYFSHHHSRFDAGIIAASTLTSKGWSMAYFIDQFVRTKAYKPDSINLLDEMRFAGFNKHLRRRYKDNELSFYTAKTHQTNVSQMIKWAWRQRHLEDLPRNLEDPELRWNSHTRIKPPNKIDAYSTAQLHMIFNHAYNTERWCDIRIFMLLGLNCGFTQSEIGSLRWSDFVIQDSSIYIERVRPKTGIQGKWILWSDTIHWMNIFFGPNWVTNLNSDKVLFTTQTGRSLAVGVQTQSKDFVAYNNIKSKNQTAITRRWMRLVKSALEDPSDYLSFKYLRKTGASFLSNMDINNALRISQCYLCHSFGSVADKYYLQQQFQSQNDAIIQMGIELGFHR